MLAGHPDWFNGVFGPDWRPAAFSGGRICLGSQAARDWAIAIPLLIAGLKIRNAQYSIEDLLEKDIQGLAEPKTDDSSRPAPRSNAWKRVSFRKVRPRYKGGVISGRIVDPDGYSLPKSSVQLMSREAKSSEERTVAAADTDEEGRFRFTGIAPGITLWIAIKAPHYYEHRTDELKSPRTKLEMPVIVLEPFGMIEGMVVDSLGRPVSKATASVNSWDTDGKRSIAETTTDEGGYYQFLDLQPLKPIWIEISQPDYLTYESNVFTSPHDGLQPVTLRDEVGLSIGTLIAAQAPLPGARVFLGVFSVFFEHLPPQIWQVSTLRSRT